MVLSFASEVSGCLAAAGSEKMIGDEHDEATYAKILAAAEEIKAMARNSPTEAAAMFEQARHLFELAQEIRNDWLRRGNAPPAGGATKPERDRLGGANAKGTDAVWVTHSAK
jgi:hypothetical protein